MSVLKLLRMYMSVLKFQYNSWKLQILNYSKKPKKNKQNKNILGSSLLCWYTKPGISPPMSPSSIDISSLILATSNICY